jgi:hypothetical protein
MLARLRLGLAVALLAAAAGNAGADSPKSSFGLGTPSTGSAPALSGYSGAESPIERSSEANAYDRAAINDPYNQRDFSAPHSYGLTASQMLGAAAACEQLHSDLASGRRGRTSKDTGEEDQAMLEAAQQHMLDAAATPPNALLTGEAECDRVSGAFSQLQQIQIRDRDLAKALDQPDAVSPLPNRKGRNNRGN